MSTVLGGSAGTGEGAAPASGGAGNPAPVTTTTQNPATGTPVTSPGGTPGTTTLGGQGAPQSWRDALPEDIRANAAISSFQDVPSLVKSFINAQGLIGRKGAIPPVDWSKATPEEKSGFFKAIGMPDPDKYEVAPPQGANIDPKLTGWLKQTALENGILPHQASALLSSFVKLNNDTKTEQQTQFNAQLTAQLDGLKKEWGDGYARETAAAGYAAEHVAGKDFVAYLNKTGLGNDPQLIKAFNAVSKLLGEDKLREGGIGQGGVTQGDLQSQINDIMAKGNENGFYVKSHPNHDQMVEKVGSLRRQMTGGK